MTATYKQYKFFLIQWTKMLLKGYLFIYLPCFMLSGGLASENPADIICSLSQWMG